MCMCYLMVASVAFNSLMKVRFTLTRISEQMKYYMYWFCLTNPHVAGCSKVGLRPGSDVQCSKYCRVRLLVCKTDRYHAWWPPTSHHRSRTGQPDTASVNSREPGLPRLREPHADHHLVQGRDPCHGCTAQDSDRCWWHSIHKWYLHIENALFNTNQYCC